MRSLIFLLLLISCSKKQYDPKIYHDFAQQNFRQFKNSVTVNVIPTTYRLDWRKPRDLIFSLLKNQHFFSGTKHYIGHVTAEVNCQTSSGNEREFIGQTSADHGGFEAYLAQGYGFSILNRPQNNYNYPLLNVPGRLDDEAKVFKDYARFISEDLMAVMSTEITPQKCQEVLSFIREYKAKTKRGELAGTVYGFGADPKKFQGAGCAPMVQTVLEIAGADKMAKAMNQTVFIPEELLGNPKTGKRVSIIDLLLSDADISQNLPGRIPFTFPDPQRLMDFFNMTQAKKKSKFLAVNL